MKITVSKSSFIDAFARAGRKDQFSHAALEALFEYLEEREQETGEEEDLDVVACCCEWTEYETAVEAAAAYGQEFEADDEDAAVRWLDRQTSTIAFPGGIIVANF